VSDAPRDDRHFGGGDAASGFQTQALLGVPMRIEGAPVGVLEALNPHAGRFTAEDEATLLVISAQAAVALRNARQREALEVANAQLARLDTLKSEFMAIASHELRTPLTALLGFGQLLAEAVRPDLRPLVAEVREAGAKMQEVVETMEELAALRDGSHVLEKHPVSLAPLLQEAWAATEGAAALRAQFHLPHPDLAVAADPRRLGLALRQLFRNTVQFSPPGGPAHISALPDGAWVHLRVRDGGCGLAPDHLDAIFEAFRQVEPTLTRSHEGLGLGLTIARGLIERHGGRCWAESAGLDQGSTFHVRLPLA
jgi:signal transduction histidine kinase